MGSWSISIHGHGIHDNGKEADVDKIIERFISELRDAGHQLDAAHLTVGSGRRYDLKHNIDLTTSTVSGALHLQTLYF